VNIRPLADVRSQEAASPAFRAALLWSITGTALLLAAVGLAGVVGTSVARRTTEIGVRMALGATPGSVSSMVLRESLGLAALGGVVGLLAALFATRLLAGFVFGIAPADPASFALAGALFVPVVVVASLRPAWRASRVDPIEALRAD
jgi:ABC-type antimicrobial peptide transport system permease subunit